MATESIDGSMEMSSRLIRGILAPFVVPLDDQSRINESELRRYIRWLISKGIHGFFANGSTGEFTRFTFEERRQITEIVADEAHGKVHIVAGAAEANVNQVLDACSYYAKLDCDVIGLCSPYYFKLNQESLRKYFTTIADGSPKPILLYNIPAFTNSLSVGTVKKLAMHPNIIGIKDSSRDLSAFLLLMHEIRKDRPDFVFLTGTEEMLLPSLFMGADGGILATSCVAPEVLVSLYERFHKGELEDARRIQFNLLPLIALMLSVDFPTGFRTGVHLRGFNVGHSRQPQPIDEIARLEEKLVPLIQRLVKNHGGNVRSD
jgi:4-hydroxy-tetrahydrodipicolinate synthase